MILGIDYDGTWSEAPDLFAQLVPMFQDAGHECVVVTRRDDPGNDEYPAQEVRDAIGDLCPIVFCGQHRKDHVASDAGYDVDVWIDDNPALIVNDRTPEDLKERDDAEAHEYSALLVEFGGEIKRQLRNYHRVIDQRFLADWGLEKDAHTTLLWGIETSRVEEIEEAIRAVGMRPFSVELGRTAIFHNPEHDVLYVEVRSPALEEYHWALQDELGAVQTHPDYKPHMTIAYLRSGAAEQYHTDLFEGIKSRVNQIVFSDQNGKRTTIPLGRQERKMRVADRLIERELHEMALSGLQREALEALQDGDGVVP